MCRTTSMWQWAVTTVRYWLGSLQISGKLRIDHSWSPLESEKLQFLNWVEEMCKELDLDVDDLCLDQHTFPQYWIWYDMMRWDVWFDWLLLLIWLFKIRLDSIYFLNWTVTVTALIWWMTCLDSGIYGLIHVTNLRTKYKFGRTDAEGPGSWTAHTPSKSWKGAPELPPGHTLWNLLALGVENQTWLVARARQVSNIDKRLQGFKVINHH